MVNTVNIAIDKRLHNVMKHYKKRHKASQSFISNKIIYEGLKSLGFTDHKDFESFEKENNLIN